MLLNYTVGIWGYSTGIGKEKLGVCILLLSSDSDEKYLQKLNVLRYNSVGFSLNELSFRWTSKDILGPENACHFK